MNEPTPAKSIRRVYRSAGLEARVSCPICGASYAPTHDHQELRYATARALEAALMNMCHFCFRCRRPACPECWDPVNGICGACVVETGLTFRSVPPPLEGTLFPPEDLVPREPYSTTEPLLTWVQGGRFHIETAPIRAVLAIEAIESGPVLPVSQIIASQREDRPRRRDAIAEIPTIPERSEEHADEDERPAIQRSPIPTPKLPVTDKALEIQLKSKRRLRPPPARNPTLVRTRASMRPPTRPPQGRLLRVLGIACLALLAICLLVTLLAELLPSVDTFVASLIKVDIRASIDNLLRMIQLFQ